MIRNFADHSANERTFLAWVRTVIAIEGFGIAAARLSSPPPPVWTEILLLSVGGLVVLIAFLRMRTLRRRIDADDDLGDDGLGADAFLLALTAALFALLAVFSLHLG
jgi:inner membrane protein YidH